jgi:hypothetical protein
MAQFRLFHWVRQLEAGHLSKGVYTRVGSSRATNVENFDARSMQLAIQSSGYRLYTCGGLLGSLPLPALVSAAVIFEQ